MRMYLFTLLAVVLLVACGNTDDGQDEEVIEDKNGFENVENDETNEQEADNGDTNKSNNDDAEIEQEEPEENEVEEIPLLTQGEAYNIVSETLTTLREEMELIVEENFDQDSDYFLVTFGDGGKRVIADQERYDFFYALTDERFSNYIVDDIRDDLVTIYIDNYLCSCHGFGIIDPSGIDFNVIEQDERRLSVSFVQTGDEAGYKTSGTYFIDMIKEEDNWKLNATQFKNSSDLPLNLTAADFKDYKINDETPSSIEEITHNGKTFILVEYSNFIYPYNAVTGDIDNELMSKYNGFDY